MRSLLNVYLIEIPLPFINHTFIIFEQIKPVYLNIDLNTFMSLGFFKFPSARLTKILSSHNLPKPVYNLEYGGNKEDLQQILNSISGIYICFNLLNSKMYVGSASLLGMYRIFRGHLYLAKGGSKLVNRAVKKYGIQNFAFIVIETVFVDKLQSKKILLTLEKKYMDLLKPKYNILKFAGSVLDLKWSLYSRMIFSLSIRKNQTRMTKFRALQLGKIV